MAYTNIDDPSAYFQANAYTGNGSNGYAITNDGNSDLQPDLWWAKNRDKAYDHAWYDSTRGVAEILVSNSTAAAVGGVTDRIASFDTNGFTLNGSVTVNENNNPHVAWQWKANGGTTASNTSGATTTTVQANQDAGFSILTWTGNGAATTLGHGLGVEPEVIIQKARGTTSNWAVYHKQANATPYNVVTYLNLTDATGIASNSWGTAASDINSNTFYLKHWFNYNTTNVAYCFASKQGYSKFGKYVGNGTSGTDGTFIYTGFKPAWVMTKRASSADAWVIYDNKRDTFNPENNYLLANTSAAETTTANWDFVSNGFKSRTGNSQGASGVTFIYMAFAENPFVTSTGIPTTAR